VNSKPRNWGSWPGSGLMHNRGGKESKSKYTHTHIYIYIYIYTGSAWGWLISLSNLCAGRDAFQTNKSVHHVMVRIRIPVTKFPFRKTGFVGCVLEPVVRKGPPLCKHLFPRPPGYSSGVLPVFVIDIHFTRGHTLEQGSSFSWNYSMQVCGTCGQKVQNTALFGYHEFTH